MCEVRLVRSRTMRVGSIERALYLTALSGKQDSKWFLCRRLGGLNLFEFFYFDVISKLQKSCILFTLKITKFYRMPYRDMETFIFMFLFLLYFYFCNDGGKDNDYLGFLSDPYCELSEPEFSG